MKRIKEADTEIFEILESEVIRQQYVLNMIPSENYASLAVMEAMGSVMMNKYSEGYPYKRYYQGNANVDELETIAINRAKKLFGAEYVNVQPLSGSPANFAVFLALLKPGEKFMGLDLSCGGHLTHGSPVNFSGKWFETVTYGVNKETGLLDMEEIKAKAQREKPKMIISGLTAYPRIINFRAFQQIADEIGAYHLADISHIAGLVVAGAHPSPLPFTDIVTTTTHKTLRGPRGGIIMTRDEEIARFIDRAVFPGSQGGPHDNATAAKAICFQDAMTPEFKTYAHQIVANAKALAETLHKEGITLATGGTDNHLLLINLLSIGEGLGRTMATALENAHICCNANTIPYDPSTPFKPSGLRLGTPILTTRGMKEGEMQQIGRWIASIIKDPENEILQQDIMTKVKALCEQYPVYTDIHSKG